MRFFSNDAKSANFPVERRTALAHGQWAVLTICCLLCSATGLFAGPSGCVLPKGLYQSWWRLEREYEGDPPNAATGRVWLDQDEIQRRYLAFAHSLAEASLRGNGETFQRCLALAKGDPFASLVAALVEYLHYGRRRPSAFIASLPRNKKQLADFWDLDLAVSQPRETITALPGIPLPDGLAEKITTELFLLVRGGNRAAAQEYFFLYGHADGAFSEFMMGQVEDLIVNQPQVILRQWQAIRPYANRIASDLRGDAEYSPRDWRNEVDSLRAACRKHPYPSCAEALRIFH